jgi:hypothetical protein
MMTIENIEREIERVKTEYEDALKREEREIFEHTDSASYDAVMRYSIRCLGLLEECREKLLALLAYEQI